jgi:hypothetical protein
VGSGCKRVTALGKSMRLHLKSKVR